MPIESEPVDETVPSSAFEEVPRRTTRRRPVVVAIAIVASVVLVASLVLAARYDEEAPAEPDLSNTEWASELARTTYERMASFDTTRWRTTTTYDPSLECFVPNPYVAESEIRSDGTGHVDANADGTVDAFRSGDDVLVSRRVIPEEWGLRSEWLAVPSDPGSKAMTLARFVGPLTIVGPLAPADVAGTLPGIVQNLQQFASGPTSAESQEVVDGVTSTRYRISFVAPEEGDQGHAEVWVSDDGTVHRLLLEAKNPPMTTQLETLAFDEPFEIDIESAAEVTNLDDLPLAPIAAAFGTGPCVPGADMAAIAAKQTCLENIYGDATVRSYTEGDAVLAGPGC